MHRSKYFVIFLIPVIVAIVAVYQNAKANPIPTCTQPTSDNWVWTVPEANPNASYWHYLSSTSITFIVPEQILKVDYFNWTSGQTTNNVLSGQTVTGANEASAFCKPIPPTLTPTATNTAEPTITSTPTGTATVEPTSTTEPTATAAPTVTETAVPQPTCPVGGCKSYCPYIEAPMPPPPAEAKCDWPSRDIRWEWKNYGGFSAWHIGPLEQTTSMTVPGHILIVWSSLNGTNQPNAFTGDNISFTEATSLCK